MKRVFLSLLLAGTLAACQSTPVPEQKEAPVVDSRPDTGPPRVEVDRKPVKDVDELAKRVEEAKDQSNILLLIQRGQNNMFAAVTPK